jgi:hypothetical protein
MRPGHKLLLWFAVTSQVVACAQTQKREVADPAAQPFFFRIRRSRLDKAVCAIVRADGFFHMEQETSDHVEIAQGTLDEIELATLKTILGNNGLAALTQQNIPAALIPVPTMMSEPEVLQITVLRSSFTQNVEFPDRESRRPFDEFINPLLHWTDLLQKHSRIKLDEDSGRTNCLPPRKLEFSTRLVPKPGGEVPLKAPEPANLTPGTAPSVAQPAPFLMRWQFSHVLGMFPYGTVEDTCIVVYSSGRFRMEKSTQNSRENPKMRAFENSLSESELQQLQELLDEPALRASTHQILRTTKSFREGEVTAVAVSRDGRIQELSFATYFGFASKRGAPSVDLDDRLVRPLQRFLKSHVETRKLDALPDASVTRCTALPQAQP